MQFHLTDDFDAVKIAQSGQCFRWYPRPNGQCRIIAGNRTVLVEHTAPNTLFLHGADPKDTSFWHTYLDLDLNYANLRAQIDPLDPYLTQAAQYGQGIRILQQNPWEMLITFLLSQRKSIPAIQKSIEALCRSAGTPIGQDETGLLYAFPTPEQLASLDESTLAACGLGYRLPYIQQAAQRVAQNPAWFDALAQQNDDELLQSLLSFYGVGDKIAHCVMLFGFHRLNAFPKDVWIHRILDAQYPNGYPFARYAPYNGIFQQYLFFFGRASQIR